MKVVVVSDVHSEFHQDKGREFFHCLFLQDFDVLVIAGDLGVADSLEDVVDTVCRRGKGVVFVCGNHEFYHSTWKHTWGVLQKLSKKHPNFHILENSTVTISGQRFIGCTLWFPDLERTRPYRGQLNDFHIIGGFTDWFDQVNAESMSYLRHNVQPDDVVVTHHIPTHLGVHPRFAGNHLNGFFVCDMEDVIRECHPKLWCYGHGHDSMDFTHHGTRLVCNPFGYAGREENPGFDWKKVIEL